MRYVAVLGASVAFAACSGASTTATTTPSKDVAGSTDGTDGTDGTDAVDSTDGTDGASTDVEETGDATASDDTSTGPLTGANACTDSSTCGAERGCYAGVCVSEPAEVARLTDNSTDSFVDDQDPNLACVGLEPTGAPGASTVTIYGVVDRFGDGRKTVDIEVSVFPMTEWPPKWAEGAKKGQSCADETDLDTMHECFNTAVPSNPKWVVMSTDPGTEKDGLDCEYVKQLETCGPGYECVEISSLTMQCESSYGLYEVPDVPTDTPLVIRSVNRKASLAKQWKDTYVYNTIALADHVEDGDRYRINALMVSFGQWTTVPNTLQVPGGIKKNNGAVGGRVRDCPTADRRGFTLKEAAVSLIEPGSATGYFNDNELDTVPLRDRKATDRYGRFTIVDVKPGPNTLASVIRTSAGIESLGREDFFLPPDSLVVLSMPGKLPIFTK